MNNFESVKVCKVAFTKPIAVVINPNSGMKINLIEKISSYLQEH